MKLHCAIVLPSCCVRYSSLLMNIELSLNTIKFSSEIMIHYSCLKFRILLLGSLKNRHELAS